MWKFIIPLLGFSFSSSPVKLDTFSYTFVVPFHELSFYSLPTFFLLPTVCIWISRSFLHILMEFFLMFYTPTHTHIHTNVPIYTSFFHFKFPSWVVFWVMPGNFFFNKMGLVLLVNLLHMFHNYFLYSKFWKRSKRYMLRLKVFPLFLIILLDCVICKMIFFKSTWIYVDSSRLLLF